MNMLLGSILIGIGAVIVTISGLAKHYYDKRIRRRNQAVRDALEHRGESEAKRVWRAFSTDPKIGVVKGVIVIGFPTGFLCMGVGLLLLY